MLRTLFRNVAISAGAFFAVSVVGLLLVPELIGAFGVAGFGTITLARLFLPTAALGVFDFGFGETATQAVAAARSDGDWARGSRLFRRAWIAAAGVGGAAGLVLLVMSAWLPEWLRVPTEEQEAMRLVLQVTACLLPLQFASLAVEGAIKGFERFGALRMLEVVAALSYATLAIAAVHAGGSAYAVCYALLVALVLRSSIGIILMLRSLRSRWVRPVTQVAEEQAWFVSITRSMAANKVLGTSQTQLAPLLIGLMFGPAGAGTYDALSRLPRAIKAVLGLLSSTVLPAAARLERASDTRGLQRLGQAGLVVIGIIALPPVTAAMVFSKPLLGLWLGPDLGGLWAWQALMFLIPGLSVLLSFGGTALLIRPHVIATMNRWTGLQVALQFLIALAAARWLDERAFVLGQVLAVATTFGPQLRLVCNELGIARSVLRRLLHVVLGLAALSAMAAWPASRIDTWTHLAIATGVFVLFGWSIGLWLGLTTDQREKLTSELRERTGL